MLGDKKGKPSVEIGLNVGDALKSVGMADILDRVLKLVQDGKLEVKIEVDTKKKGRIPASVTVRLKRAQD